MYQNVVLEERTVKVLALLGVLAFVGMAMAPLATGDAWVIGGYYLTKKGMNAEAGIGWGLTGVLVAAVYGGAIGAAFGSTVPGIGTVVGAAIGV